MADETEANVLGIVAKDKEQKFKEKIRRGFATKTYYSSSPQSKKYSGHYWTQNIRQIFETEGSKLVEHAYYCVTCDDIIITNARTGTGKINRHIKDHLNAFAKIRRVQVAEMLSKCVSIGIKYGLELDVDFFLQHIPRPKTEW